MNFRIITTTIGIAVVFNAVGQANLNISSGTNLVTTSGTIINLQNTDLVTNGIINQQPGQGKFLFSGTVNNSILGTTTPTFDVLEINKSGGLLSLGQNINIGTSVNFTSGNIDLSNYILSLQPVATLNGESNVNRLLSSGTGYASIITTLNAPSAANPGNLGAILTSSQNLGTTTIKRGFTSQVNGSGHGSSILRYYDITPANDNNLNATLRINYFDNELNGLDKTQFVMWKSVNNLSWSNQGYTTRDPSSDYVELTAINGFSRWTLSTPSIGLYVTLLNFYAQANNCKVIMQWNTGIETNFSHFDLERSTDNLHFSTIATISGKGSNSSYQFEDNTPSQGINIYRLKMVNIDNSTTYSAAVSVTLNCTTSIRLYPNPVKDLLKISGLQSAQNIFIISTSGQTLIQKTASSFTEDINMSMYAPGIYFIKITDANGTIINNSSIQKY